MKESVVVMSPSMSLKLVLAICLPSSLFITHCGHSREDFEHTLVVYPTEPFSLSAFGNITASMPLNVNGT